MFRSVPVEYLEIKFEVLFENWSFAARFLELAGGNGQKASVWRKEFAQYSKIFRTKDHFKRVSIAGLMMFFQ